MRALVLSGGGSKSAWSTGVLQHLLGDLHIQYDIIVGVSSGAINAAFLGMYPLGNEKSSVDDMSKMWLDLRQDQVYKKWKPFGILHVVHKQSFYDSSPLRNLLKQSIDIKKIRSSGKKIIVGTVSLTSGKYTNFDQTSDNFIDAVIGSSSFPCLFEPIKIEGHWFSDGGIKSVSPITSAIEMGATHIDAIVTSPETRDKKFIINPSIIDIMKRSFDLFTEKIMSNDIEKALMYNKLSDAGLSTKKIISLNIVRPKHNLIEDLLDFTPSKIKEMIGIGYNDALDVYRSNLNANQ
jgi:NTE family protein